MLLNGNYLIGKNLNHENSISENFLGEERNFPGFGPGMLPSPPSAARASFLSLILGNFVPHLENFRKYYIFEKDLVMDTTRPNVKGPYSNIF